MCGSVTESEAWMGLWGGEGEYVTLANLVPLAMSTGVWSIVGLFRVSNNTLFPSQSGKLDHQFSGTM